MNAIESAAMETLREENHQLRARLAQAQGIPDVGIVRRTLRMPQQQSVLLCILLTRGIVERDELVSALYSPDVLVMLGDAELAVSSLVKHVRRCIRPHGLDVETYYGYGYGMSDEHRQKLRAMLPTPEEIQQGQWAA